MGYDLVVMGASWGGLHALETVLAGLPARLDAAVVVAQHRSSRGDDALLGELLDRAGPLPVRNAQDKDPLMRGRCLLAPAGYHLLVDPGEVSLSLEEPVRYSRPSVDVLFESAADAYRERVVAVVLTGANEDGAEGLRAVHRRGGAVAVQDPDEAEAPQMPQAALDAVPAARRLALSRIAPWVRALAGVTAEEAAL